MRNCVALLIALALPTLAQTVRVPFVGCESFGQMAIAAPKVKDGPHVKEPAAQGLAFYEAVTAPGILAPRNWHCIGANGSSGAVLYVTPDDPKLGNWIQGPVVEVDYIISENGSGMDEIAAVFAQAFPHRRAFVRRVRDRLGLQPNDYKFGPFRMTS